MSDIATQKTKLRKIMQLKLKDISPQWLSESQPLLVNNLKRLVFNELSEDKVAILTWIPHFYAEANLIAELESVSANNSSISIYCPCWMDSGALQFFKLPCSFKKGQAGIQEPDPRTTLELRFEEYKKIYCLVPGLAFDRNGVRLGRGKGVYDRFFSSLADNVQVFKVGVCWSFQLIGSIPSECHDQRMDALLTEEEIIDIEIAK